MDALSNPLSLRNLYPSVGGSTIGQAGSPTTPETPAAPQGLSPIERGLKIGLLGEPVKFWILLTVILFVGMWLARKFGGAANFANVKFSLYNIIAIVILTIVGQSIAKVLAARFPIPGISTIILAA